MALMLTATACYGFANGLVTPELFVGTLTVPAIIFYFNRDDRNKENGK